MITIENLQALTQLLLKQTSLAQNLLDKLTDEHEVLSLNDSDLLDRIVEHKQALMKQLEAGMTTITHALSEQGYSADISGLDSLLQQLPENTPLHRQWHKLQELAKQCQEKNMVNGGIVSLKQRHIRQALDILTGTQSSKNTYDKQGEVDTRSTKSTYTKA
ncbi:MAG: flagellar protein FlgN [Candidatus Polarisedimenticolaceae bacterium]|nr:flagellar protein FlgN [Candidatus Polarisedimenticolaceae bacterium]